MIDIQMKSSAPLTKQTITSINNLKVQTPLDSKHITNINTHHSSNTVSRYDNNTSHLNNTSQHQKNEMQTAAKPVETIRIQTLPPMLHTTKKGQKTQLFPESSVIKLKACLGWNVSNPECDVDVSAFMLSSTGKVPGDDWFVFYGQTTSPDGSLLFKPDEKVDRESITIDLAKLDPMVSKVVFVLTINEAYEKNLNLSMIKDAYIRILNCSNNSELVSFKMDEYYSNVTSMMIGEIYKLNGNWKFNAIGNGVARDLAGLCELYGVQVI